MAQDSDDFSFPMLAEKEPTPLTAFSTVTNATCPGAPAQPVQVSPPEASGRPGKVYLEKGYSQLDWMRLTQKNKDLTGGLQTRRDITLEEVAMHATPEDGWLVVRNKVYYITPYLKFHPGGETILRPQLGKDATAMFQKYHPWVNVDALLGSCVVGLLARA